ncbi:MAG: hypothetical protein WCF31_04965 [Candidatus Deferrimicrobiaceae bacterium]
MLLAGYGLSGPNVAFFELFGIPPPGFEEQGLAMAEDGLQHPFLSPLL